MDATLVKAVRDHAIAHYKESSDWEYIVEEYTDEELWNIIANANNINEAIMFAHYVSRYDKNNE